MLTNYYYGDLKKFKLKYDANFNLLTLKLVTIFYSLHSVVLQLTISQISIEINALLNHEYTFRASLSITRPIREQSRLL